VKDYAPGYSQTFDGKMKNEVLKKISKLENELGMAQKRDMAMKQIISGEEVTAYDIPYKVDKSRDVELTINETKADGERVKNANDQIEQAKAKETAENRPISNIGISDLGSEQDLLGNEFLFFTPLKGNIGGGFNARHPYVDIIPAIDETVKATMDGTVVFSSWTPEYGFTISVLHQNNWMSVYKFNAAVYKEPGSFVRSGETIGITGYTDKANPKKQLRFELWHNGIAVDPLNYIVF
jgi:murein DD-endopeptidase MepM/ murein hydrolase activator NlpD